MNDLTKVIAVIGGTGGLGSALAFRWGNAGYKILIGSRNNEKASVSAQKLNDRLGKEVASGYNNREASKLAEIIVLTIPFPRTTVILLRKLRMRLKAKLL